MCSDEEDFLRGFFLTTITCSGILCLPYAESERAENLIYEPGEFGTNRTHLESFSEIGVELSESAEKPFLNWDFRSLDRDFSL